MTSPNDMNSSKGPQPVRRTAANKPTKRCAGTTRRAGLELPRIEVSPDTTGATPVAYGTGAFERVAPQEEPVRRSVSPHVTGALSREEMDAQKTDGLHAVEPAQTGSFSAATQGTGVFRATMTPTERLASQNSAQRAFANGQTEERLRLQPEDFDRGEHRMEFDLEPKKRKPVKAMVLVTLIVVVLAAIGSFAYHNWDINHAVAITLNGEEVTVEGAERTINGLLDDGKVSVKPGNYVAVDGSVMRKGEGNRAAATVNKEEADLDQLLVEGDVVLVKNGTDVTEPCEDSDEESVGYETVIEGLGPMHVYTTTKGEEGTAVTRKGKESGITVQTFSKEPVNLTMTKYKVDSKGDKVIALTFDDGPWPHTTEAILDTLEENDVKATFFCIGKQMPKYSDQVKRMKDAGHQICTHTYDHADGSGKGVNITFMSPEEQREEVEKGYECIKDITGEEASTVVRLPGGNLNEDTAANLSDLITCEVGWNVDTLDWKRPGADAIYNRIMKAKPGDIILMHDGGGDRTQTAEAIARAIPELKKQGYTFVTIDELLEKYPYSKGE